MRVHFVEATNGPRNWGKFAVCQFTDEEWKVLSQVDGRPLLAGRGWGKDHYLILDLQTGEGAFFGSYMHRNDLSKHQVWVCPMYEYAALQILDGEHDPMSTPALLDFPDAPFAFSGYRRGGPRQQQLEDAAQAVSEAWTAYIGTEDVEGDDDVDVVAQAIAHLREVLDVEATPEG